MTDRKLTVGKHVQRRLHGQEFSLTLHFYGSYTILSDQESAEESGNITPTTL